MIELATERSPGGVDGAALRGERFRGWLRVGDQEVPSTSAVAVDQAAGMGVEAVLARPLRGPGDRVRVASENPLRCNGDLRPVAAAGRLILISKPKLRLTTGGFCPRFRALVGLGRVWLVAT